MPRTGRETRQSSPPYNVTAAQVVIDAWKARTTSDPIPLGNIKQEVNKFAKHFFARMEQETIEFGDFFDAFEADQDHEGYYYRAQTGKGYSRIGAAVGAAGAAGATT